MRDDGAALYRLCETAGCARYSVRGHPRDRVRGGGGDGAPVVGAAGRQTTAAERLCRQIRHAVSAGDWFCPRWRRAWRVYARSYPGFQRARACRKSEVRDRSRKSLSKQLHRPCQGRHERRQRGRGAPALSTRRRAGAVDAAGCDGQVRAQRAAWRLEQGAE